MYNLGFSENEEDIFYNVETTTQDILVENPATQNLLYMVFQIVHRSLDKSII